MECMIHLKKIRRKSISWNFSRRGGNNRENKNKYGEIIMFFILFKFVNKDFMIDDEFYHKL